MNVFMEVCKTLYQLDGEIVLRVKEKRTDLGLGNLC
jgi:hypothetical protein